MSVTFTEDKAEAAASCNLLDDTDVSPLASVDIAAGLGRDVDVQEAAGEFAASLEAVKRLRSMDHTADALESLLDLTDDEGQCVFLGQNGAAEACCYVLKRSRAAPETQLKTIKILSNLAFNICENKARIRDVGALDSVVLAMLHSPFAEDLQLWGIITLLNLCDDSDENCDVAVTAGAVEAIFLAVETFSENWTIITQACAVFINLSRGKLIRRNRFRAASGIPTLLTFLERPDASETIVISTLVILANLSSDSEANQVVIGEPKALQLILQLLHEGVKKKEVGYRACGVLRYLAFDEQNRNLIGRMGGLQATIDFIRTNEADRNMVTRAFKCLNNSVYDSNPNKTLACNSGGIQITLSSMKKHDEDVELVGTCVRLLRNLLDGVALNQKIFCDVGGPTQLAAAVSFHRNNKEILDHAAVVNQMVAESNSDVIASFNRNHI